jgi:hypothetical protein
MLKQESSSKYEIMDFMDFMQDRDKKNSPPPDEEEDQMACILKFT